MELSSRFYYDAAVVLVKIKSVVYVWLKTFKSLLAICFQICVCMDLRLRILRKSFKGNKIRYMSQGESGIQHGLLV